MTSDVQLHPNAALLQMAGSGWLGGWVGCEIQGHTKHKAAAALTPESFQGCAMPALATTPHLKHSRHRSKSLQAAHLMRSVEDRSLWQ